MYLVARVDHDVGSVGERVEQVGRGHGVVDDQRHAVGVGHTHTHTHSRSDP